jgi:hypothetical protein
MNLKVKVTGEGGEVWLHADAYAELSIDTPSGPALFLIAANGPDVTEKVNALMDYAEEKFRCSPWPK